MLKEKDDIKTKFLTYAAHNLRTPATAFRWALSDFLKDDYASLPKDTQKSLHELYAISLTLMSLIEDFLDVSKIELHQFEISLKPEPLSRMKEEAHRIIHELTPIAKEKHISIKTSLALAKEDTVFLVDMPRIARVMENLVENAVHYTLDHGHISVELEHKKDAVQFSITDTGIGIPEKEQEHVFEQFFRSSNAKKHKSTGSGIGLFLAQKLVEAHGGQISFESKEGKGSTFVFTLPITSHVSR